MVGDGALGAAHIVPSAAQIVQRLADAEEIGGGSAAKRNDDFGLHDVDLLQEKWRTGIGFDRFRHTVFRRAALHDVSDVHLFAAQSHGGNHIVEQLARLADERLSRAVLVGARRLAEEEDARLRVAHAEHRLRPRRRELRAARTAGNAIAENRECRDSFFARGAARRCKPGEFAGNGVALSRVDTYSCSISRQRVASLLVTSG